MGVLTRWIFGLVWSLTELIWSLIYIFLGLSASLIVVLIIPNLLGNNILIQGNRGSSSVSS